MNGLEYFSGNLSFMSFLNSAFALSEIRTESVLIYEINPIFFPLTSTPSYNCWAILIVFLVENPRIFEDSCCKVLVIKGG